MKNAVQILSILFLFANTLSAQSNALRFTPLKPVLGKFNLQYEHVIAPRSTLLAEYQYWDVERQNTTGFAFIGFANLTNKTYAIDGFRLGLSLRQYKKSAMKGFFGEGGLYIGNHDIKVTETSSSVNGIALLNLEVDEILNQKQRAWAADNVRVLGIKLGCGWVKRKGNFTYEFSGGLNAHKTNGGGLAEEALKNAGIYTRFAIGLNF